MSDPRILRPGPPTPNGIPPAAAMTLVTCNRCGAQVLVPGQLAPISAQQHEERCIGHKVERILDLLSPDGPDGS